MDEQWRSVVGYEGMYEVSPKGRVRSLLRSDSKGRRVGGRELSIITHPSGHLRVKLSRDGKTVGATVHRLVLTAFVGPQPPGCEVLHGDGDPGNNNVDNLRWGTRSENILDSVRHGTHFSASKTTCPLGHAYDETNTHTTRDGKRMCRTCLRNRTAQRRAKQKKEI